MQSLPSAESSIRLLLRSAGRLLASLSSPVMCVMSICMIRLPPRLPDGVAPRAEPSLSDVLDEHRMPQA